MPGSCQRCCCCCCSFLLNLADVCISVAICHTMWQLWVAALGEGDTSHEPGLVHLCVCTCVYDAIMKLIPGPVWSTEKK